MRSSRSNANQTCLLGHLYCDADHVSSLITADEKVMIRERCSGSGVNIIDCHCQDLDIFIEDVGGLELDSKEVTRGSPLITQNITVIPRECFNYPPSTIQGDIVGIRLGDIISARPRRKWGVLHLNDKVRIDTSALSRPVFQGKQVVLFATGVDVIIEALWWRRHAINLFEAIAAGGFYAVVGMNFSLFIHECPLAQLININKSLLFCEELDKRGVSVIPHIYAVNNQQRTKWIDYLNHHPNIKSVAINTQMQRNSDSMREVELTIFALMAETQVNILLNGRRPKEPRQCFGKRVFFANQSGLKQRAIVENALQRDKLLASSKNRVLALE